MSRTRSLLTALLTLSAVLLMAGTASARSHDRNHDRIPDRWEKRHSLSLNVKQTRRDQDKDGLTNLGEFKAGLDPRDADTDNDGLDDSAEHAGQITTFDGTTLTLALAGGGTLSGDVVSGTTECDTPSSAQASSHDEGDDSQGTQGDDPQGDDDQGDQQQGDDHGGDESQNGACDATTLVPGAQVKEAELKVIGGKAVFTKIELG